MKKAVTTVLFYLTLSALLSVSAFAKELVVGGQLVGIQISTQGVLVAEIAEVDTAGGRLSPAGDAGIRAGDLIVKIGDTPVSGAGELIAGVEALCGAPAELTVRRNERTLKFTVQPVRSAENQWMMGMWLRDGISGIGTVTFSDPGSGTYGALGHSISDLESGVVILMRDGKISRAEIVSIKKGCTGEPGELNGCADMGRILGTVEKNTLNGIFGHLSTPVGSVIMDTGELSAGRAEILCTVAGQKAESYSVEITRLYDDDGSRHALLTVTDPKLLALTGGIVQGMSGSPIIQNGKLTGAVTHVFVSDPTRGYAVSIQDMLASAGIEEKAA